MAPRVRQQELLGAFAELLSYPVTDPAPVARRCRALASARGAGHLDRFIARAERARGHEMEEIYSSTFDLDPACAPYVGHHLAGETPKRGLFMARLAEAYRQDGFAWSAGGGELPDHVPLVLRYLAAAPEGPSRRVVLEDALLPALGTMLDALSDPGNPYRDVLTALREEVVP